MTERTGPRGTARRQFLKVAGVTTGVSAIALATGAALEEPQAPSAAPSTPARNDTVRMVNDLERALTRPVEARRWGMVIDPRRCIGCHACAVSCIVQNALPVGVPYRTVPDIETGSFPAVQRFFMPMNCMQCENAPCIEAANAVVPGAMGRRPDGIVTIDYSRMKGRQAFDAASKACPYSGALYFDEGRNWTDGTPALQPYEKGPAREYGRGWSRAETKGTTRKCHFCIDRIEGGKLPACVATCTGQAMHFGDLADGESLVSELMRAHQILLLENDAGTSPRVMYVDESLEPSPESTCGSCHQ